MRESNGQNLKQERWQQAEATLLACWELAPEHRDAFLRRECGDDAELLSELRSLTVAEEAAGKWCSQPAPAVTLTGHRLGPYELERLLGRGGLGAVYLAHRADGAFDHQVAVKIIGLPFELEAFRERFRRERQILASLNHPNITRLLDGGVTSEGQLYLVMEYVDGVSLDTFSGSLHAKLNLFRGVCAAVQYAHQNLIIHRDIKPSNILIDTAGVPKLLDFGAAKLLADIDTTQTGFGMMTAAYASPEQLSGELASTLSDIFSLGAVLYELVTGERAFGDDLASRVRGESPDFAKKLPGDLSRIVRKALAPVPVERYATAGELAEDVRRYCDGEAVAAHPPSFRYRAGKFLRRHWLAVTAAAVFAIGLSAASIVALQQAQNARTEALKAKKVSSFLAEMMATASQGKIVTVEQMMGSFEPRLVDFSDDPATEASLRANMAASYTSLGLPDRAAAQLQKALSLYQAAGNLRGEVMVLWLLGQNEYPRGTSARAVGFYRQALERLGQLKGNVAPIWTLRVKRDLANHLRINSTRNLAQSQMLLDEAIAVGRREPSLSSSVELIGAEKSLLLVLALEGKNGAVEVAITRPSAPMGIASTDEAWSARELMRLRNRDFAAARDAAAERFAQAAKASGPESVWALTVKLDVARFRAETGDSAAAFTLVRETLPVLRRLDGKSEPFAGALSCAAQVSVRAGHFAEAESYARESLQFMDELQHDPIDGYRAEALQYLGEALAGQKRYRQAIEILGASESMYRESLPAWTLTADHIHGLRLQAEAALAGAPRQAKRPAPQGL